jgi:hypothetical protein
MKKLIPFILVAVVGFHFTSRKGGGAENVKFPMKVISKITGVKSVPEEERIRVLLFTGTEWCPASQHLESTVIGSDEWKEFAAKEIRFRAFDFPADRSGLPETVMHMVKRYEIKGYPTMLVLGPDNEELSRQVGSGPPVENFKSWIRKHKKFYDAVKTESAEAVASVENSEKE